MEKSHDKGMSEVADIMPPKGDLNSLGGFLVLDFDKCSSLTGLVRPIMAIWNVYVVNQRRLMGIRLINHWPTSS